jgi:hypothetical protein
MPHIVSLCVVHIFQIDLVYYFGLPLSWVVAWVAYPCLSAQARGFSHCVLRDSPCWDAVALTNFTAH